jgi:hypothetical protein
MICQHDTTAQCCSQLHCFLAPALFSQQGDDFATLAIDPKIASGLKSLQGRLSNGIACGRTHAVARLTDGTTVAIGAGAGAAVPAEAAKAGATGTSVVGVAHSLFLLKGGTLKQVWWL